MESFNEKRISKKQLLSNLNEIKKNNKKICAMVKADAYGHGIYEICKILKGKLEYFGVANISEALEIRKFNNIDKILIVGICEDYEKCIKNNIEFTIENERKLYALIDYMNKYTEKNTAKIHIKVNTGMNRIGINMQSEFKNICNLCILNNIEIAGIFTHFSTADCDNIFFNKQYKIFNEYLRLIPKGINPIIHIGGTNCLSHEIKYVQMLRVGIGLYGYSCEKISKNIKPILSISSKIIKIINLKSGDRVGYSNGYICEKSMKIGIIPLGYADGVIRALKYNGYVYINNKRCSIVGNICMDMFMIDITTIKKVKENDKVIVFNDANIWKTYLNTNEYEILTNFSKLRGKSVIVD